jgi:hypothetical protein
MPKAGYFMTQRSLLSPIPSEAERPRFSDPIHSASGEGLMEDAITMVGARVGEIT